MKQGNEKVCFVTWFRQFIRESHTGKRLMSSGKKIKPGTIVQYQIVLKLILEYEFHTGQALRICLLNKRSMRVLLREKKYWLVFYKRFCHFLYKEKKYFDNYCTSVFKILKTFFNYLRIEKSLPVGEFHKKFTVPGERFRPVTLSPLQLRYLILDKSFEASLSPVMKKIKDIFVFGCMLGLRSQDLLNLKKADIQNTAVGLSIVLHTRKTGAEVRVPLPDYVIFIIEKYRRKAGRYILPRISGGQLNIQIKKLMALAGWTDHLPKIRHRGGEPVEIRKKDGKSFRFCDHITVHSMRRTAITTLLLLGVDEATVRRISGHSPGSKEFYRYVALVQEYLDATVKAAHRMLVEGPEFPI